MKGYMNLPEDIQIGRIKLVRFLNDKWIKIVFIVMNVKKTSVRK